MVHLLNADRYYIDTLRGERPGLPKRPGSRNTAAEFASERATVDAWLVDFCETVTATICRAWSLSPGRTERSRKPLPTRSCMSSCTDSTTAGRYTQRRREQAFRRPSLTNSS